jgi:hypothetical protein
MLNYAARPNMRDFGSKETIQRLQALGAKSSKDGDAVSIILRGY